MTNPAVERFRALVEERFRFLLAKGFRRLPADDRDSPVGASVAYAGRHVGFLVSYDVRDRVADLRVVRVRAGRLAETGAGGYSRNLLSHLVEHAGYRAGGAPGAAASAGADALENMVGYWAELLEREGAALLADGKGALPEE